MTLSITEGDLCPLHLPIQWQQGLFRGPTCWSSLVCFMKAKPPSGGRQHFVPISPTARGILTNPPPRLLTSPLQPLPASQGTGSQPWTHISAASASGVDHGRLTNSPRWGLCCPEGPASRSGRLQEDLGEGCGAPTGDSFLPGGGGALHSKLRNFTFQLINYILF